MANPPLAKKIAEDLIEDLNKLIEEGFKVDGKPSAFYELSRRSGVNATSLHTRYKQAGRLYNLKVRTAGNPTITPTNDLSPKLLNLLKGGRRRTLAELVANTEASTADVLDGLETIKNNGANIHRTGDTYEIISIAQQSFTSGPSYELVSRPDNTFLFGAAGDLHAASKYTRWDVREDLYRQFSEAGAQCTFDTGNWIDGECNFNRYDIECHGLDAQCRTLAERHPRYKGLHTFAVWGDDHEGWYATREGIDVGKYCEAIMRKAGHEWTNIGFMESHITLRNYNTGTATTMAVVHPGGGSSYALSYAIQKIIESYEGGEKPAVALYGHYHKLWAGLIRNVWCVQTGCGEDQTPFMRKKRLEAHVGGALVHLEQDPDTGSIVAMSPKLIRYFNKGFYDDRWSKHGSVTQIDRSVKNI